MKKLLGIVLLVLGALLLSRSINSGDFANPTVVSLIVDLAPVIACAHFGLKWLRKK